MPDFGKISIGYDWITVKTLLLSLSSLLLFTPFMWLAIPVIIYIGYSIIHEFIHLAAVRKHGGLLVKLSLEYPDSSIYVQMPTIEAERAVFGVGALADVLMMLVVACILFLGAHATRNLILAELGILFVICETLTALLPAQSDMQQYFRRSLHKI